MPLSSLRAVLFDLDGTLVHSPIDFAAMRKAVLDLIAVEGLDPREFEGRDALAMAAEAGPRTAEPARFHARVEAALVEIELAACAPAREGKGARETLAWLRDAGLAVGIVTRNSPEAVARILSRIPLPHDVLLTRRDTPRVKPDAVHLRLALERLRVPAAAAAMVGDHAMDVAAGKAAGTRTVGVLNGRPSSHFDGAAPDVVIRTLPELRWWISR